jgi:hypothetical protein
MEDIWWKQKKQRRCCGDGEASKEQIEELREKKALPQKPNNPLSCIRFLGLWWWTPSINPSTIADSSGTSQ